MTHADGEVTFVVSVRFEVAPPDGWVAFMREDQQPTAGTRQAFVENVEMYCQKTAGNVG